MENETTLLIYKNLTTREAQKTKLKFNKYPQIIII